MKTTPIPVKFDRQGHSCNFHGGFGPTVFKLCRLSSSSCVLLLPKTSLRCCCSSRRICMAVWSPYESLCAALRHHSLYGQCNMAIPTRPVTHEPFGESKFFDTHTYTFSSFWLRSSVVSVLISVTTDMSPTGDMLVIFILLVGNVLLSLLRGFQALHCHGTEPGAAHPSG